MTQSELRPILFCPNRGWFNHSFTAPCKIIYHCGVHWQAVFYYWSWFGGVTTAQPTCWWHIHLPYSVGWLNELRFAVGDSIWYSLILEEQVHSNFIIFLITTPFSIIRVFTPFSSCCRLRKPDCWDLSKMEWPVCMWPVSIICLQLKASKSRVILSCNF